MYQLACWVDMELLGKTNPVQQGSGVYHKLKAEASPLSLPMNSPTGQEISRCLSSLIGQTIMT